MTTRRDVSVYTWQTVHILLPSSILFLFLLPFHFCTRLSLSLFLSFSLSLFLSLSPLKLFVRSVSFLFSRDRRRKCSRLENIWRTRFALDMYVCMYLSACVCTYFLLISCFRRFLFSLIFSMVCYCQMV